MSFTYHTDTVSEDGVTLTVNVVPDEDPESPRTWDNLGVMFCHHRNYLLGDVQIDPGLLYEDQEDLVNMLREQHDPRVMIPLYLLDHSGLSIRAGAPIPGTRSPFVSDPQGWDTSMVGFIMDTAETRAMMGVPDDAFSEDIAEALHDEIETYDTYLRGSVAGYEVVDEDGEVLDSCWGYYNHDDCWYDGMESARGLLPGRVLERQVAEGYRDLARTRIMYAVNEVPDDADVTLTEVNGVPGAFVTVRIFVPASDSLRVLATPGSGPAS